MPGIYLNLKAECNSPSKVHKSFSNTSFLTLIVLLLAKLWMSVLVNHNNKSFRNTLKKIRSNIDPYSTSERSIWNMLQALIIFVFYFVFQVSAVECLCDVQIFFKTLQNTCRRMPLKYGRKWNTINTLIFFHFFSATKI